MSVDKLINYDQGEDIIEALGDISDKLDDLKAITPADFGLGYAVCDTPAATAAKTATLANYVLTEGAPVSVKFTYANTASNATLNLNSTGAKPIYYKGSAIGNDVISAGDICTFIYSTTVYNIINIDTLTGAGTGTVTQVGAEGGIITDQSSNADITRVGKVKLNLKDTTLYESTAPNKADTTKIYPVALDDAGHPCVGVPWTDTTYTQATDSAIIVDNTNHTIDVAAATTSAPGVVQLEDSYSSTSTTTSAVPNAVKAAYDLANGKYTKPQTGIPAEDLATAVQTSLTAADNAVPKTRTVNSKALSSDITLTAADVGAIATTAKGANGGVAELDANGKVPSSQLPSYVDDVLEYSAKSSFPATGETGKIYVDTSTNKTYRWGGSAYVEISESLALGDTSSTAYYGDKGKTAYEHSQVTSGNPHNVTKTDVGLGNVGNFKAVSTVASQGLSDTEKANARTNIGAGTSSFSGSYSDLSNKPTLGTAAAKDVPASGNASTSQVVMGNDSRLSDARTPTSHTHTKSQITDFPTSMPASDVSAWAKASTKPTYTASEVGAIATTEKGAANGVASLDSTGKVPSSQLPSSSDDHPFFTVPINHNMIYRGQNLGDTFTAAQHTALSSGNFIDLYLGDYWTKSVTIPAGTYTDGGGASVTVPAQTVTLKAVIADFDTFYAGYASDYAAINTHHAAVIVTGFSNVAWNSTNTTAGGYLNSLINKWLVGSASPAINTWLGSDKVLSHKKLLTNFVYNDSAFEWDISSQKISLLSENQIYGFKLWGNSKPANGSYEPGEAFKQLNVFNHIDANLLFGNNSIWLRDLSYAEWAAILSSGGFVNRTSTSSKWVAPAALILLS